MSPPTPSPSAAPRRWKSRAGPRRSANASAASGRASSRPRLHPSRGTMTAHHIRYELDGDGVATLAIDRPEKRNAMTYAMLGAFIGKVDGQGGDAVAVELIADVVC